MLFSLYALIAFAITVFIFYKIYRSIWSPREGLAIPTYKLGVFSFYYTVWKYLYGHCGRAAEGTYVLQGICAFFKIFENEKIGAGWMLRRQVVILTKPEAVEAVMSSHSIIDKSYEYSFLHMWLGRGLLTSTGEKWRNRRKLLTPSFHFRILDEFISVFDEESKILVNKLKKLSQRDWIDIVPLVTMCTLDSICETIMGVHIGAQENPEGEYVKSTHEIAELTWDRTVRPWLWNDRIFFSTAGGRRFKKCLGVVQRFTREVIKKRKEIILKKNGNIWKDDEDQTVQYTMKKKKAFLELLLEMHIKGEAITEEDIREEVDTFMFEGHDTTAMAICWTLYTVGLYPEVQMKVKKEIQDIFGDDKTRPITSDDIKAMKYLDCVLKETLRLYPSVPVIAREVKENIDILGYTIRPRSAFVICPYMIHRDPKVYPNPEVFDPDRFLPENSVGRNPFAYIPFSAGPRNCIGQKFAMIELKTVVANIFRNFEIESLDQREKVNVMTDIIIRSEGPLRLKFKSC